VMVRNQGRQCIHQCVCPTEYHSRPHPLLPPNLPQTSLTYYPSGPTSAPLIHLSLPPHLITRTLLRHHQMVLLISMPCSPMFSDACPEDSDYTPTHTSYTLCLSHCRPTICLRIVCRSCSPHNISIPGLTLFRSWPIPSSRAHLRKPDRTPLHSRGQISKTSLHWDF